MRSRKGSLLPFFALGTAVFVAGLFLIAKLAIHWIAFQSCKAAAEAASIAAVNSIAPIVIEDPHFGFLSLTDWPSGSRTRTSAGEPVPVLGINTVLATSRSNLLIARRLASPHMIKLAEDDAVHAENACRNLESAIKQALLKKSFNRPLDRDGKVVNAYENARRAFDASFKFMDGACSLQEFALDAGYLAGSCTSLAALPRPIALAELAESGLNGDQYNAFVNIPAGQKNFYFAGLARSSSLVSDAQFRPADSKRISSVVRCSARVSMAEKSETGPAFFEDLIVASQAAAIPGGNEDLVPAALMVLSFPHGRQARVNSFADILNAHELSQTTVTLQKAEGDFPDEQDSRLVPNMNATVSNLVAKGLYDWLRSCHGKLRIDELERTLGSPFSTQAGKGLSITYYLDETGCIKQLESKNYSVQTVQDQQDFAIADETLAWGKSWTFSFRDQVSRLGVQGGKHAGMPLVEQKGETEIERIYRRNGLAVSMEFSAPI